jgi:hypothetical protein
MSLSDTTLVHDAAAAAENQEAGECEVTAAELHPTKPLASQWCRFSSSGRRWSNLACMCQFKWPAMAAPHDRVSVLAQLMIKRRHSQSSRCCCALVGRNSVCCPVWPA